MSQILLSVLIPTVLERAAQFHKLRQYIFHQLVDHELTDIVEIVYLQDNKEMTIGAKRNKLYRMAKGVYSLQVDDDDWLHPLAIPYIVDELNENPDCVGYKELCIFDGKRVESSSFSLKYPGWLDNYDGFNHVRTPFFKTPIKTRLCLQCSIPDIRFGEDHEFAKMIHPLLTTENYIDEFIYHYIHNSTPHNDRYGIA
jgi:glycosyltransferase involved in cell wall biosynthesis